MWRVSFGVGGSFPGWQGSKLIDTRGWTGRHSCTHWHYWWPFKQGARFPPATIGTFLENAAVAGLAMTTLAIHPSFHKAVASSPPPPARPLLGIMALSPLVV